MAEHGRACPKPATQSREAKYTVLTTPLASSLCARILGPPRPVKGSANSKGNTRENEKEEEENKGEREGKGGEEREEKGKGKERQEERRKKSKIVF